MIKSNISMIASGIHLMRSIIRELTSAFAEYKALAEVNTNILELDKRLLILLDFAKESFFADDHVASKNYTKLISEFRREIQFLNTLRQIKVDEYPLLKNITEEAGLELNELNTDFSRDSPDSL